MSFNETGTPHLSSDFILLEGLYQLVVTGNTEEWEFQRLSKAVHHGLLAAYGEDDADDQTIDID